MNNKFGPTVLMTIGDSQSDTAQIFMPKDTVPSCRTMIYRKIYDSCVHEFRLQEHLCNIKILIVSDRAIMHIFFTLLQVHPKQEPSRQIIRWLK